jgi:hypothetical protein
MISLSGSIDATTAWGGFNGRVLIFNLPSTTYYKRFVWTGSYPTNTTKGNHATVTGGGSWLSTSATTSITVSFGAANIAAGAQLKLYKVL